MLSNGCRPTVAPWAPYGPVRSPPAKDPTRARKVFASALRSARTEMGLSQEELADEAKVHRTYVGHLERAEKNVSIDSMQKLADAVGKPLWMMLRP
jgi:ribosome-binding protein aMBF1 (putative translation factor)